MDRRQGHQRRFGHLFTSPLTALKGAVALLRHRPTLAADAAAQTLLATIERSIERITQASDLIQSHSTADDDGVLIRIPGSALPGPRSDDEPHNAEDIRPRSLVRTDLPHDQSPHPRPDVLLVSAATSTGHDLQNAGHTLVQTDSAIAALDLARQHHPGMIILDLDLDQFDWRFTQVLQEDPETKAIPILFISHDEARLRALPMGPAFRILHDSDEIADTVAKVLKLTASAQPETQSILIVDDEPDICTLLALELETSGFRTVQVNSGTEALLCAQQQRFDLIILDLMLPDLDGFAVLGGLRARAQTALTPIILLSALNQAREKVQGLQLGADDYITKPFVLEELSARVQAAIRRSELEGSTNPSTRLPGNIAIERAISRRIEQGQLFAVCYCDLDNFKSYNDAYGFLKGDAVIHQTARILVSAVEEAGNPDDFVGHIGGDDFVLVTTPDRAAAVCEAAIRFFDALAPLFYDPEARERGYIEGTDRRGRQERFPLVSISIMVVSNQRNPIHHMAQVAQQAIELKKLAKRRHGSVYVLDS